MTKRSDNSERKRRPDAWEVRAGLTDEQQRQAFAWARNLGYAKAIGLIAQEFNVDAPSIAAFSGWYEFWSEKENEERVHKAITDGAAISDLAKSCGDVSEAMVAALESEASAAILSGNPERIKLLVSLALKARQSRFDEVKYKDEMKSAIERGLDALAEEARGNKEALKYYNLFRKAILKTVENAK